MTRWWRRLVVAACAMAMVSGCSETKPGTCGRGDTIPLDEVSEVGVTPLEAHARAAELYREVSVVWAERDRAHWIAFDVLRVSFEPPQSARWGPYNGLLGCSEYGPGPLMVKSRATITSESGGLWSNREVVVVHTIDGDVYLADLDFWSPTTFTGAYAAALDETFTELGDHGLRLGRSRAVGEHGTSQTFDIEAYGDERAVLLFRCEEAVDDPSCATFTPPSE